MKRPIDTICAISTPLGVSGIGIVRLSGPKTFRVLAKVFKPSQGADVSRFISHTVHLGRLSDGRTTLDEVLITVLRAPRTYTREDMAEIGCHGSPFILKAALRLCLRHGCRMAEPGEFTRRAFLHGRLDLAQAAAVPGIIHSKTEKALSAAVSQLAGSLSSEIEALRRRIAALLARVELSLDLAEDTGSDHDMDHAELEAELQAASNATQDLIRRIENGRIVSAGIRAAILGRPNVGKSSLFNALLHEERAIVTALPGTTRDFIEGSLDADGIPLMLIDTAGVADAGSPIETAGVRRSLEWLNRADVTLMIFDGSRPLDGGDRDLLLRVQNRPAVLVVNKSDLPRKLTAATLQRLAKGHRVVEVSALKGLGLERLTRAVTDLVWHGKARTSDDSLIASVRQESLLSSVSRHLRDALATSRDRASLDFITLDLREASEELARFLGRSLSEEALDEVFSFFCVGK